MWITFKYNFEYLTRKTFFNLIYLKASARHKNIFEFGKVYPNSDIFRLTFHHLEVHPLDYNRVDNVQNRLQIRYKLDNTQWRLHNHWRKALHLQLYPMDNDQLKLPIEAKI